MSLENSFDLTGHLGSDAEIRFLPTTGKAVATISLATNTVYTDRETGERKEVTKWFRLTAYGAQAEFLQKYGKKGAGMRFQGDLNPREYDHKTAKAEDGSPLRIYTIELRVREIGVNSWAKTDGAAPIPSAPAADTAFPDDDIPY